MKTFKFLRLAPLVLMAFLTVAPSVAKTVKTVNPLVDHSNTTHLFIDAVELTPDSTTLTFRIYYNMLKAMILQPDITLSCNGESYPVRHASGIELDEIIEIPFLGDTIFSISFEPIPMDTKVFDFIEKNDDRYFQLRGIHTDKSFDDETPLDDLNLLPQQNWEKGNATLKGRIINHQPSDESDWVSVRPCSPIGMILDNTIGSTTINPDGTFEVTVQVYQSFQPCILNFIAKSVSTPGYYGLIYLSPGKESTVTIDPTQRYTHTGKDGSVVFTGANQELNNQLSLDIAKKIMWDTFFYNNYMVAREYDSAPEFKSAVLSHTAKKREKIQKSSFTPMMKQLLNLVTTNDVANALADTFYIREFKDLDASYFDFYQELDVANPILLWTSEFDYPIKSTYTLSADNLPVATQSPEGNLENKIDKAIDTFTRLYGRESTMINQLIASNAYINHILESSNTLSEESIANCRRRLPDIFFDYVMEQNDYMAKTLSTNADKD